MDNDNNVILDKSDSGYSEMLIKSLLLYQDHIYKLLIIKSYFSCSRPNKQLHSIIDEILMKVCLMFAMVKQHMGYTNINNKSMDQHIE